MLFAYQNNTPNAGVVELGDEIYIAGQGYDLSTLEILPGKFIGSPSVRYISYGGSPIEPLLLKRSMVDSRRSRVMRNVQDDWAYDNYAIPVSTDQVMMGYSAVPPASLISGRDFVVHQDGGYEYHYRGTFGADGVPSVENVPSRSGASSANATRYNSILGGSKNKYQGGLSATGPGGTTFPAQGHLRCEAPAAATAAMFYTCSGVFLDADDEAVLSSLNNSGSIGFTRHIAGTLTGTQMLTSTVTNSAADINMGTRVGIPAQLIDGKRRVYLISLRLSGGGTHLPFVAGNYSNLAAAVPGDFMSGNINLNGFTVPKTKNGQSAFGYFIKGDAGKNYIVAFLANYGRGELGETMVFEEAAYGQLKLIGMYTDTVANGMRSVLSISESNKEWIVLEDGTVSTWRWNATTLRPERVASIGAVPPAAAGVDTMGRLWVMERTPSAAVSDTYKIHVFPAAGSVAFVKAQMADARYQYVGSPIMTTINVEARDVQSSLVQAEVVVELTGPVIFDDGSKVKRVVTATDAPVAVPVRVIGGGNLAVSAGI